MDSKIEICKTHKCGIIVTGIEDREGLYAPEFSPSVGKFSFLDTVTINGLCKVDSNDEETLELVKVVPHTQEEIDGTLYNVPDESIFQLKVDGLYRVTHVILPTIEWLEKFAEEDLVVPYEYIYLWDGTKVVKYEDEELKEVCFQELFDHLNGEKTEENTNIAHTCQETFSLCKTERCYFKIAAKLLQKYCPASCDLESFKELIYKRDLLWMAMNVIKYLLEKSDFLEAQRIMEHFIGCNDFCKEELNEKGGRGCGCNSNN